MMVIFSCTQDCILIFLLDPKASLPNPKIFGVTEDGQELSDVPPGDGVGEGTGERKGSTDTERMAKIDEKDEDELNDSDPAVAAADSDDQVVELPAESESSETVPSEEKAQPEVSNDANKPPDTGEGP